MYIPYVAYAHHKTNRQTDKQTNKTKQNNRINDDDDPNSSNPRTHLKKYVHLHVKYIMYIKVQESCRK